MKIQVAESGESLQAPWGYFMLKIMLLSVPFSSSDSGLNLIKSVISHYRATTHVTAFTCQHAWPVVTVVIIITVFRQVQEVGTDEIMNHTKVFQL